MKFQNLKGMYVFFKKISASICVNFSELWSNTHLFIYGHQVLQKHLGKIQNWSWMKAQWRDWLLDNYRSQGSLVFLSKSAFKFKWFCMIGLSSFELVAQRLFWGGGLIHELWIFLYYCWALILLRHRQILKCIKIMEKDLSILLATFIFWVSQYFFYWCSQHHVAKLRETLRCIFSSVGYVKNIRRNSFEVKSKEASKMLGMISMQILQVWNVYLAKNSEIYIFPTKI